MIEFFAALAVALGPAGGPTATAVGLRMWIPPGWHEVERKLTPCDDPAERLSIAGPGGGLVHLQERAGRPRGFPSRPARFHVQGGPEWIACCAPTRRGGWLFRFREEGRGFYAYVYGTTARAQRDAIAALNSLQVD